MNVVRLIMHDIHRLFSLLDILRVRHCQSHWKAKVKLSKSLEGEGQIVKVIGRQRSLEGKIHQV
jgi:hypothetical protein